MRIHLPLTVEQVGQMILLRLITVELLLLQTGQIVVLLPILTIVFSTVVGDGNRFCGRFFAVDSSTVTYKA